MPALIVVLLVLCPRAAISAQVKTVQELDVQPINPTVSPSIEAAGQVSLDAAPASLSPSSLPAAEARAAAAQPADAETPLPHGTAEAAPGDAGLESTAEDSAVRFDQAARRRPEESASSRAPALHYESSAEIEHELSPQIMAILTTTDGTIGPILGARKPPRWLPRTGANVRTTLWEPLSYNQKIRLLRYATKGKSISAFFFGYRAMAGLRVKDSITLRFAKPVVFLGKEYAAGTHEVDVRGVFGAVEHRDPHTMHAVKGVELHLRESASAGRVLADAWTLLDGLGIARVGLHVHIVAPLPPQEKDATVANLRALLDADRYRRANLLAEAVTIVHGGGMGIYDDGEHFQHLNPMKLSNVAYQLMAWTTKGDTEVSTDEKMGWIGFRPPKIYDQPGLYGYEYRGIVRTISVAIYRVVLDAVQRALLAPHARAAKTRMSAWLAKQPKELSMQQAIARTWYDGPLSIPRSVVFLLTPSLDNTLVDLKRDRHLEVSMLVHDWSNDPMLFDRPEALARVEAEQLRGLRRLEKGDDVGVVMKDFLQDSGLFETVLNSFGLKRGRFGRPEPM